MTFFHKTVLIDDTIRELRVKPSGIYVDATLGGGGLSYEILRRLDESGRLISLDIDPEAIEYCKSRFVGVPNICIVNSNFSDIDVVLKKLDVGLVDGIAMDLGLSSHQIDCVDRGFSYMSNAPLDMRMSKKGISAYDVVNFMSESEISEIIWKYGEERFSKRIARSICDVRKKTAIKTTGQLADIIKGSIPKFSKGNPAKRTFQAIRIAVNDELENLERALDKCIGLLKKDGRLAVISFHSLEDRIVKNKMNFWSKSCICPEESPICTCGKKKQADIVTKKVIIPGDEEIQLNSRCRSAKLRVCQKK